MTSVTDGGVKKIEIASTGGAVVDIADWDITKVRYIFVDPINGNDANIGYIEAVPGTDFTGVDLSAISVKTTHRINELRPICGNGRMCVVLIGMKAAVPPPYYAKKDTGTGPKLGYIGWTPSTPIVLDDVAPADALGMDDRHLRFGYSLLHTRGSDLTNSAADQGQLGFITSATYAGGGATGEWTVASATAGTAGTAIKLTGAVFPAGVTMTRYRLRVLHAGFPTYYIPVRWTAVDSDDVDTLVAWSMSGPLSPGDSIWIEEPGIVLNTFKEAASYVDNPTNVPAYLAGINVMTGAYLGCPDDPERLTYISGVVTASAFGVGAIQAAPVYTTETGTAGALLQFGLTAQLLVFNGKHCALNNSVVAGTQSTIVADYIDLADSSLLACTVSGGSNLFSLSGINSGLLTLSPVGVGKVTKIRPVSSASPNIIVLPENGFDLLTFGEIRNLRFFAEGTEPNSPAITLKAGQYGVLFIQDWEDIGESSYPTLAPGNGVLIEYDAAGTAFTPLTWASLQTTGFEIEGLQKVVCRLTGAGYPDDILLCPRGKVMRVFDTFEGPVAIPTGSILAPRDDGSGPSDIDIVGLAYVGTPGQRRCVGVALTNTVVPSNTPSPDGWGWVVVGNDGIMIVELDFDVEGPIPAPGPGDELYLSDMPGAAWLQPNGVPIGHVPPLGIRTPTGPCPVIWTYHLPKSQATQRASDLIIESSTTLVDFATAYVKANRRYIIESELIFNANAAGGIDVAWAATVGVSLGSISGELFAMTPAVALADVQSGMGVGTTRLGAAGPTNGTARVKGIFTAAADGAVSIQASQHTSNPAATTVYKTSWFRVTEV